MALPASLCVQQEGDILHVQLARPEKRNALNDETLLGLEQVFTHVSQDVRVAILTGQSDHFCTGLDLSELEDHDAVEGVHHSRTWHRVFARIQFGPVEDKLEARYRGPNVTPGYWRHATCFDEEGFFRTGDAIMFVDENDPNQGLLFNRRLTEDFKLTTGTWVNVGVLRAQIVKLGELRKRGLRVRCEVVMPVRYDGIDVDAGYRLDMLIEEVIVIENKAVQELLPIHEAQLITYLKLSGCKIGFLLNWNVKLMKDGINRYVNGL